MKFGNKNLKLKKEFAFLQYFFLVGSDLKERFLIPIMDWRKLAAKIEKINVNLYFINELNIRFKKNQT